jgi:hypothetical protein
MFQQRVKQANKFYVTHGALGANIAFNDINDIFRRKS